MRIDTLASAGAPASLGVRPEPASDRAFADLVRRGLSSFAEIQAAADEAAQSIAVGDLTRLHDAIIAIQRASLALEFLVVARNHFVDGVQELLRTQV